MAGPGNVHFPSVAGPGAPHLENPCPGQPEEYTGLPMLRACGAAGHPVRVTMYYTRRFRSLASFGNDDQTEGKVNPEQRK